MSRYIKKLLSFSDADGSNGAWSGFEIATTQDLSRFGLLRADDLTPDELRAHHVTTFTEVTAEELPALLALPVRY